MNDLALIFRSEKEGVGKKLMFEEFIGYSILGSKYVLQTTDIDEIIGRFSMINNKLLVILDGLILLLGQGIKGNQGKRWETMRILETVGISEKPAI